MSSKTKCCKVNSDGSVSLEDILNSFNSSIREEHAWALCYQCAKYFNECITTKRGNVVQVVTEVRHVYLQTDGNIDENTIENKMANNDTRRLLRCERDMIAGLGVVIYTALDQGSQSDEERVISQDLEQLISDMISDENDISTNSSSSLSSTQHETDDEGIERDEEENATIGTTTGTTHSIITLQEIVRRCEAHLGTLSRTQAEAHYKAVVRALVAEALELSTFLERVAQGGISLPTSSTSDQLDQLQFSDWARFWVQVMGELRMGVKLKKVHPSRAPIEYELTPYEILMKDIRSCRYNLRKIMVNGDVPSRVTKDAHAIILDFIRSRPPLKKVSDRKLPPQLRTLTPREQLLNSIKKGRKLRPTPRSSYMMAAQPRQSPKEEAVCQKAPVRRLIKVDFSQFKDEDDEDDDGGDDDMNLIDSPDSTEPGLWSASTDYFQLCDTTLEAYDLATQDLNTRTTARRHTLEVFDPSAGCYSVPQSRPCSRQSCNSSEASESVQLEPEMAKAIQEELTGARSWQETISLDDRLSLTLAEIVHIRAVLTKAELEALPVEGRVRHDVEARKVCFLCLKTRFGIFGPWGHRCTLCKRTVCTRCCCKMNIPMEHFSSVPVVLLSPSIMCTPEDETTTTTTATITTTTTESFPKSLVDKIIDAGPSLSSDEQQSPDGGAIMTSSTISDPGSLSGRFRTKATAVSRAARVVDKFKASQMVVCLDCKMMVLQIIKSARANRAAIRNKTLQSLTLNLSPVF